MRGRRAAPEGAGGHGDGARDDAVGPRWSYGPRGHALAQSLRQIVAQPFASTLTLLALGVVLTLPALLLFSAAPLDALATRSLQGESLTLYLDPAADDAAGAALAAELAARPDVVRTRHVDRAEALAAFRELGDVDAALEALGTNPLPGAVIVRFHRQGETVEEDQWRAFLDLGGRIVVVALRPVPGQPMAAEAGRALILQTVAALRQAGAAAGA